MPRYTVHYHGGRVASDVPPPEPGPGVSRAVTFDRIGPRLLIVVQSAGWKWADEDPGRLAVDRGGCGARAAGRRPSIE